MRLPHLLFGQRRRKKTGIYTRSSIEMYAHEKYALDLFQEIQVNKDEHVQKYAVSGKRERENKKKYSGNKSVLLRI